MLRYLIVVTLFVTLTGCNANLPGVYDLPLPADCEAWLFTEESHVGEVALALACPGVDLLRLYPWPPVQPWDESPSDTPAPESTPQPYPHREL